MPKEELRRRLTTAQKIFARVLDDPRFVLVINDDLALAVEQIDQCVQYKQSVDQSPARHLVQELLQQTQQYLKEML